MLGVPDGTPHGGQNPRKGTDTKLRSHPANSPSAAPPTVDTGESPVAPPGAPAAGRDGGWRRPRCRMLSPTSEPAPTGADPREFPVEAVTAPTEAHAHSVTWHIVRPRGEAEEERNHPRGRNTHIFKNTQLLKTRSCGRSNAGRGRAGERAWARLSNVWEVGREQARGAGRVKSLNSVIRVGLSET